MEERIIIEQKQRIQEPLAKPVVTVDTALVLTASRATISTPFHEEVGAPRRQISVTGKAPAVSHPLRRAIAWDKKLAVSSAPSHAAFARRAGISGPTLTRHLQLLRLLPEIREFLLGLSTAGELRRFSLNRMSALARLDPDVQRERWTRLRSVTQ
jgi:hypothetical protein